ncbi:MAG TPA: GDSL-type esterase/lipase family protein [Geminicoccaceae bacterium]|nr:GDSL-type esterase/lipase family protein [Geminicoccaceae bacterium]
MLYALALHFAVAALIVETDFLPRFERKFLGATVGPEFDSVYFRWARGLEGSDRNARPGALLFVGDSIMRDLDTSSIARHTLNLAIPGDTTARVRKRLSSYQSLATAPGLILGVGINDFDYRSVEQALRNYRDVLGLAPRDVPVLVLSVLPVDSRVRGGGANAYAARLNAGLRELCTEHPGCRFVDAAAKLADASGNLIASAHDGDGLHLSRVGHDIYWSEIYRAVERSMPPARVLAPDGGISSD